MGSLFLSRIENRDNHKEEISGELGKGSKGVAL